MSSFKNNLESWVVDIIHNTKLCLMEGGGGTLNDARLGVVEKYGRAA